MEWGARRVVSQNATEIQLPNSQWNNKFKTLSLDVRRAQLALLSFISIQHAFQITDLEFCSSPLFGMSRALKRTRIMKPPALTLKARIAELTHLALIGKSQT